MPEDSQISLLRELKHEYVARGAAVFHKGETGKNFYLILKGSVYIMAPPADLDDQQKGGKSSKLRKALSPTGSSQKKSLSISQTSSPKNNKILNAVNSPKSNFSVQSPRQSQQQQSQRDLSSLKKKPSRHSSTFQLPSSNRSHSSESPSRRTTFRDSQLKSQGGQREQSSFAPQKQKSIQEAPEDIEQQQDSIVIDLPPDDQPLNTDHILQLYPRYTILKTLDEGDHFGEIALNMKASRTATVIAAEHCHFLILGSSAYNSILGEFQNKYTKLMVEMVKRIPMIRSWGSLSIQAIIRSLALQKYQRNNYLYKIGEPVEYLYIVKEGEVELTKEVEQRKIKSEEDYINIQSKTFTDFSKAVAKNRLAELNRNWSQQRTRENKVRMPIALIGEGQSFGDEEIMKNVTTRTNNAIVRSAYADIYYIPIALLVKNSPNPSDFEKCIDPNIQKTAWRDKLATGIMETRNEIEKKNASTVINFLNNQVSQLRENITPLPDDEEDEQGGTYQSNTHRESQTSIIEDHSHINNEPINQSKGAMIPVAGLDGIRVREKRHFRVQSASHFGRNSQNRSASTSIIHRDPQQRSHFDPTSQQSLASHQYKSIAGEQALVGGDTLNSGRQTKRSNGQQSARELNVEHAESNSLTKSQQFQSSYDLHQRRSDDMTPIQKQDRHQPFIPRHARHQSTDNIFAVNQNNTQSVPVKHTPGVVSQPKPNVIRVVRKKKSKSQTLMLKAMVPSEFQKKSKILINDQLIKEYEQQQQEKQEEWENSPQNLKLGNSDSFKKSPSPRQTQSQTVDNIIEKFDASRSQSPIPVVHSPHYQLQQSRNDGSPPTNQSRPITASRQRLNQPHTQPIRPQSSQRNIVSNVRQQHPINSLDNMNKKDGKQFSKLWIQNLEKYNRLALKTLGKKQTENGTINQYKNANPPSKQRKLVSRAKSMSIKHSKQSELSQNRHVSLQKIKQAPVQIPPSLPGSIPGSQDNSPTHLGVHHKRSSSQSTPFLNSKIKEIMYVGNDHIFEQRKSLNTEQSRQHLYKKLGIYKLFGNGGENTDRGENDQQQPPPQQFDPPQYDVRQLINQSQKDQSEDPNFNFTNAINYHMKMIKNQKSIAQNKIDQTSLGSFSQFSPLHGRGHGESGSGDKNHQYNSPYKAQTFQLNLKGISMTKSVDGKTLVPRRTINSKEKLTTGH